MEISKEQIDKILKYHERIKEEYDNYEIQDAPECEWEEYNYMYIVLEEKIHSIEHILDILEIDYNIGE